MYGESADLSQAAVNKTQQAYTDTLKTLSDAESLQLPTVGNMTLILDAADEIKQQVERSLGYVISIAIEKIKVTLSRYRGYNCYRGNRTNMRHVTELN